MRPSSSSAGAARLRALTARSISKPPGWRSLAAWIASQPPAIREAFVAGLSGNAVRALPFLFEIWAHPAHQLPPPGDWTTWVVLGGRGAGKTRAGAEWVRAQVEGPRPGDPGVARRIALVAETWAQARDVMAFGESGIVACSPPDRRPAYVATKRRLVWSNGAEAQLYSAADPESLRGPQFDCAWSDELAKWRKARHAWDMLQFGLRLGERPRQMVTTTPRDMAVLREIVADPASVVTSAETAANSENLAPDFLRTITRRYVGTAQGRQELGGELLTERPGALFTRQRIEAARVAAPPPLDRIVVGVDPPVTGHAGSDECGIVVAGRAADIVYVLADRSVGQASPALWAARVVEAWRAHDADRVVAEVNQGGALVAEVIRRVDPAAPVVAVRARHGKAARAEPVALLYEQGRVRHVGLLPALEDQLCAFGGEAGSPDRVDALVWAIADLMADGAPRIRAL